MKLGSYLSTLKREGYIMNIGTPRETESPKSIVGNGMKCMEEGELFPPPDFRESLVIGHGRKEELWDTARKQKVRVGNRGLNIYNRFTPEVRSEERIELGCFQVGSLQESKDERILFSDLRKRGIEHFRLRLCQPDVVIQACIQSQRTFPWTYVVTDHFECDRKVYLWCIFDNPQGRWCSVIDLNEERFDRFHIHSKRHVLFCL